MVAPPGAAAYRQTMRGVLTQCVVPAEAGTLGFLDSRLRGNDGQLRGNDGL